MARSGRGVSARSRGLPVCDLHTNTLRGGLTLIYETGHRLSVTARGWLNGADRGLGCGRSPVPGDREA